MIMKAIIERNNLVGIGYTILHALAVPLIYVMVKHLTHDLKTSQVVFFYKFALLLIITPWVLRNGLSGLKTNKIHLHLIRAILSTAGSICVLQAVKQIGIIDVTAVTYLENVLIVFIGMTIYKEQVSYIKIAAIALSCLGMLIILYPNILSFSLNEVTIDASVISTMKKEHIILLIGVTMQLLNWMVIKKIGNTDTNDQQLFYITFLSSITSFFAAFIELEEGRSLRFDGSNIAISFDQAVIIIGIALCYLTHTVSIFKAFQSAEMSTIAPFDYTRLIFSGIYGAIFFDQIPQYQSYVGYTLITISGIALIKAHGVRGNAKINLK